MIIKRIVLKKFYQSESTTSFSSVYLYKSVEMIDVIHKDIDTILNIQPQHPDNINGPFTLAGKSFPFDIFFFAETDP